MLFLFKAASKKYYSNKKQIDGKCYPVMLFNFFPGSFHPTAPMYIVKNQDGLIR